VVITASNYEKYREQIISGKLVIYGLDQAGYKQLLKNNSEFKRYIEQQKSVIVYYEGNL